MLQKLKGLAAEAEDNEEIVSDLINHSDSDSRDKSRDHITTKSTVSPVLICHTGYTRPTIMHSWAKFPQKKYRYDIKIGCY